MIQASEELNHLFQALADPCRRGMIDQLTHGPASVKDLAGTHGMALPSAVKHLRILENAGLVTSRKAGRVRTFQMQPHALQSLDDWLSGRKRALNQAFDRLEALIEAESGTTRP